MGVKERRQREKQELRQGILDAAREIAAEEGWQAVTIRKVAELIEYSPPMIYEHFTNKEDLLLELAMEGFRKQLARVRVAYASTDDPEERLVKVALAQCSFAWDHPELYRVMHGMGGASCSTSTPPQEIYETRTIIQEAFRAVMGDSAAGEDLHNAMDLMWGTLHGLISLVLEGLMYGGSERANTLAEHAVHNWLAAWQVQKGR